MQFLYHFPDLSNARDNYFQRLCLENNFPSEHSLQNFPREFAKNESFRDDFSTAAFF